MAPSLRPTRARQPLTSFADEPPVQASACARRRTPQQRAYVSVPSGAERTSPTRSAPSLAISRSSASELRQRDAWLAGILGRGADELDGLARSLKDRDLGDIVTSLDRFARRQPGLFMGAAVGLGFALTRLAKSSADRRHEEAPHTAPPVPPLATPSPHTSATPPAGTGYGQGGLA